MSADPSAVAVPRPFAVTSLPQAAAPDDETVAAALESLAVAGWQVLHDLRCPGSDLGPDHRIDHVLVGPNGVVVVEVRDEPVEPLATGQSQGQGQAQWRRPPVRTRDLTSATAAATAVAGQLYAQHRSAVRPVVCLIGRPRPIDPAQAGQVVVSGAGLVDLVGYLHPVLRDVDVDMITGHLRSWRR